MLSLLISRMCTYILPLISSNEIYLHLLWQNNSYQCKVLPFGMPTALGFSFHLINIYCSFADARAFHPIIYLDDILGLDSFEAHAQEGTLFVLLIGLSLQTIH